MKKLLLLLICISVIKAIGIAQTTNPVYHSPTIKSAGFRAFAYNDMVHLLDITLPDFKRKDVYINALFFIRFNIDSVGKVCNVKFSNDDEDEHYVEQIYGVPPSIRKRLNPLLDSALRSTNGRWTPAKKNGVPCMSKPLLIVINCSRGIYDSNNRGNGFSGGKIFDEEECIPLAYIQDNGSYIN